MDSFYARLSKIITELTVGTVLTEDEYLDLFEREWDGTKSYQLLKKYFKVYLSSFDGAAEMRQECMLTQDFDGARALLEKYSKLHIDKQ